MSDGAGYHRGGSKQDYITPWEFIDAVEKRFGKIGFDLAADEFNHRVRGYDEKTLGPPPWFDVRNNSLKQDWSKLPQAKEEMLLWLNPPFDDIAPWAAKCQEESGKGARIAFLVPASVGSNWFADHIYGFSTVCPLRPRIVFEGHISGYPKDLMLCLYDDNRGTFGPTDGFEPWKWRETTRGKKP